MSCCGQKRQALTAGNGTWQSTPAGYSQEQPNAQVMPVGLMPANPVPVPSHQSPAQPLALADSTGPTMTLLSRHGVTSITGGVTGKRYRFQGAGAMQAVDRRDADAMIASGAFERVWG